MKFTTLYPLFAALLEWYDFAIYIYIADIIGALYFPNNNKLVSLIGAFSVFATAYMMRPIGGTIMGNLGDKIGRKKMLIFSLFLMGIPMAGMMVLPTYSEIGITAVILLVIFRMIQGFSIGGEYIAVIILIAEHSKDKNRGFMTALSPAFGGTGVLLAAGIVTFLTVRLNHTQMYSWGWRIPYVLGTLITVAAIIMQFKIIETPKFEKISKLKTTVSSPIFLLFKEYKKQALTIIAIISYYSIAYYTVVAFLPSYLKMILGIQPGFVMKVSTVGMMVYAFSIPFLGLLSDKIGRKKLMIISVITLAIICIPFYKLLYSYNGKYIYLAVATLILPVTAFEACFTSAIQELVPTKVRYAACGFAVNLAVGVVGGLTPLLITCLIKLTSDYMIPCYFIVIGSCLILIILFRMHETAGKSMPE